MPDCTRCPERDRINQMWDAMIEKGMIFPAWDYAIQEAAKKNFGPLMALDRAGKIPDHATKGGNGEDRSKGSSI
jgi:hypothetical protein